jgi:formylglycine-generating enzyme required for sulfatase activity
VAAKIFLNYRREDSAARALNIAQYLERAFCARDVFIDIDRIRSGQHFLQVLEERLAASKVMLVVIGKSWLEIRNSDGQRRIDDPQDWVRLEIAGAFAKKLSIIPVLVDGAALPLKGELPDVLKPLSDQQTANVNHNTFRNDMAGLTRDIRAILGWPWGWPCWAKRTAATFLVACTLIPTYFIFDRVVFRSSHTPILLDEARPRCDGVEIRGNGKPLCLKSHDAFSGLRTFKDCLDDCPEMVALPSAAFSMGSDDAEAERQTNEGPQHNVRIVGPIAVGRFPVSRAEYEAFIRSTGYDPGDTCSVYLGDQWRMQSGRNFRDPGFAQDDSHPAVCVNWNDAKLYVAWLSKKTGEAYRLLSEAEREHATRALTETPFWWGSSISTAQANYNGNYAYGTKPTGEWRKGTVPVNSFTFNPWGVYGVHGNVYDWVEDCWHDAYNGAPPDGTPWLANPCEKRVVRGGSWFSRPRYLRSSNRVALLPELRISDIGFRVAKTFAR